ncbi:HPr family phosphocarrier protein [Kitasatospora aureofaciens]|uniref:HPr family phosphocarrier protein n=1 Tax=Kitasatospora aureofaciens TaxID=1894 RepID=UPI001C44708A|nr:HPr family phosphocarrier protein [Kitasatospora aureofaciens]MBV6699711.1 HPr family phosphocarrier protein [Kitasatospora aureofaciens]
MHSIRITVGSSSGLHARPASLLVQAAARQQAKVTVGRPDQTPVDARSLLSVLALAARHGETLELTASGDGAEEALQVLSELIASDLDAAA